MTEHAELAIPDPFTTDLAEGWGLDLLGVVDRIDDLAQLDNGRAELGGYVAAYRKKGKDARELQVGERVTEIRMGELLGPAPKPGPKQSGQINYDGLPQARVSEFRKLAAHREDVLAWLKGGTRGRAALLARISAINAGYEIPSLDSVPRCAVIYADPPWERDFNVGSRAAENHYTTMTNEEIAALEPPAADDAVLFMWATTTRLPEALTVMAAWGFLYRTTMVWVKDKIGLGWYTRAKHELLLIGKRGELPMPDPANRPESVVLAPRGEHSAKPEVFYQIIERMYGGLPKAELFARTEREGWHQWGHGTAAQ
jgi:N6-adenosine-specific RNA methylase IME4